MSFADVQNMMAAFAANQNGGRMVSDEEFDAFMDECREQGWV